MTEPANTDVDSARAWSVAGGAFLALFTAFGVVYSFGEFFGPMADEFGSNRSKTAMFFSITTFVYFVLGLITGRLADRVGQRKVLLAGAVAIVAGLFLTSKVSSLEMGYLTYGAGVGFGVACCFVPMVAGVGGWFERQEPSLSALQFQVLASEPLPSFHFQNGLLANTDGEPPIKYSPHYRRRCFCFQLCLLIAHRLQGLPPNLSAKRFVDEVISGFCMAHRSCCQGLFSWHLYSWPTLFRQSQ